MKFPKKLCFLFSMTIFQTSSHGFVLNEDSIIDSQTLQHENLHHSRTKRAMIEKGGYLQSSQYDYPKEPTFFGNETQDIISEISLQWINKAAMKIVWPDGPLAQGEGVIVVTVSKQFPDLEGACLFEGRPGNEKSNSFEAVISGCMGSEETIVNLSIDNKVLELTLLKNGTTLQLQHENLHHSRTKRAMIEKGGYLQSSQYGNLYQAVNERGGYLQSTQPLPSREGVTEKDLEIPKSITFPLDLGYDKGVQGHFDGSDSDSKRFIQEIVILATSFFKRPSTGLPTITFDTASGVTPYLDTSINSDKMCSGTSSDLRRGKSKPLMLFAYDMHSSGSQVTGCAFLGAACGNTQGQAMGIVDMTWESYDRRKHVQSMSRTMAHEFGHLLGMKHDFDHQGTDCNNKGIMSYGSPPDTWSTCSVSDFKKFWRSIGFDCDLPTDGSDPQPPTTVRPPTGRPPTGDPSECTTTSGPDPNKPCIFPFKFSDTTYTSCTTDGNEPGNTEEWCSTKVDNSGTHIGGQGNWGNCDCEEGPPKKSTSNKGCGALKSKWKCTPSRSCDWYKEFVKNLGKYSTGDQKFKELKDFYDDRKCGEGRVYCSNNGKFPRDSGDLPKLKRCQLSGSPSAPAIQYKPKQIYKQNSVGCGALKSKWKCTPSRSCDWYKDFVDNLSKYSTGDQKFKELKDFYDDRKCGEGRVYCSSDGKFPRDSGDLPKLKSC